MNFLKQSTAFTFRIGPFVDDTDGKTVETGLTIAQADIQISKAGGAFAQTSDSSPTTTHDADGWYQCPFTTADTGTLGALTVQVAMSGALPVWRDFFVVTANVFDSLASSDKLQVDVTQVGGSAEDLPTATALATAQTDLDTLTGSDGVTLATTQGNYAPAKAGDAMALTSGERTSTADALLDRDMSTGTDSGSPTVRTVRQALRALRNKLSISGSTITVTKEDDSTASWTASVTTDAAADPITGIDPA